MSAFGDALARAYDGRISFNELERLIRPNLHRLARYQLSRWKVPPGVEEADVVQEMRVAAWDAVARWDPKRGVGIERFVLYQVTDRSKKWLHRQRNALRRDGKAQGRFPVSFSAIANPEIEESPADRIGDDAPTAEQRLMEREWRGEMQRTLRSIAARAGYRERIALMAIADSGGDYDEAAERLAPEIGFLGGGEGAVRRALSRGIELAASEVAASSTPGE